MLTFSYQFLYCKLKKLQGISTYLNAKNHLFNSAEYYSYAKIMDASNMYMYTEYAWVSTNKENFQKLT